MSSNPLGIRLQNPPDYTVRICRASDGVVVGTGIAVSTDGKILTCAHVVRAAGIDPSDAADRQVFFEFVNVDGRTSISGHANVSACFEDFDDDIALLQITDGPLPLPQERVAVLGKAKESFWHPFRTYGCRNLGYVESGWGWGDIANYSEAPKGKRLRLSPIQLASEHIAPGMSGAGVLDVNPDRNLVVGIITHTYFPSATMKDQKTGWAIDASVLTFDPIKLPLQDSPQPLGPAPSPKTDIAPSATAAMRPRGLSMNNAPAPLPEWTGRETALKEISDKWVEGKYRIMSLVAFGGEGKTTLARYWLETILADKSKPQPDGVFWWGFYERANVDEFFEAAFRYITGDVLDLGSFPSSNARAHLIASLLGNGRYLFILDGLEALQHQSGDKFGLVQNADLRAFLTFFAAPTHESFCLITSRVQVVLS